MDMQKIPPIHQKRIITFFNHFIISTVSFLNKFIYTCENALVKLDRKMETLEATICMLETKLNSVPHLRQNKLSDNPDAELLQEIPLSEDKCENSDEQLNEGGETTSASKQIPEELTKYHKMLQFGVPQDAVKLKMKQDGLNPDLLNVIN